MSVLVVHKVSPNARLPTKGSPAAAGYDLYAAEEKIIPPGTRQVVQTDLVIELPEDSYGRIAPRSGLAARNYIDVGAGVIDRDYRGNIGVLLINNSKSDFKVHIGDRIAQLIVERIVPTCIHERISSPTQRGAGGFGSTGI